MRAPAPCGRLEKKSGAALQDGSAPPFQSSLDLLAVGVGLLLLLLALLFL